MDPMEIIKTSLNKIEERTGKIDGIETRLKELEADRHHAFQAHARDASMGRRMSQAEMDQLAADLRSGNPSHAGSGFGGGAMEKREHTEAFTAFLRAPKDMNVRAQLSELQSRTASGATDAAGGYIIPDVILGPLLKRLSNANPFRGLVRTVQVATRDLSFPLSNADATTGWVGENATRTATTEPTLSAPRPTFGMLYSYVNASEELVMDSQFDISNWFSMEAGDAMAEAEMAAIISGPSPGQDPAAPETKLKA